MWYMFLCSLLSFQLGACAVRCPSCESPSLQVVDSREAADAVRRRRACQDCGHRFTTYERRGVFNCPRCLEDDSRIEKTMSISGGTSRHRKCGGCGFVYETHERLVGLEVHVLKASGRRERFHRGKLYRSVMVAGAKRDIESPWAESVVNEIENTIVEGGQSEVSSKLIARMVMERLVSQDEVAYVRYASSYFEAGGIAEMLDVINETRHRRERTEIERTNLRLVPSETSSQD